jgi:hypothetical protein
MRSACTYLIKQAIEEGMASLKDLGQTTGTAFPDETAEGRRARFTLMDLGEKGRTMPRESVNKYLTENAPKYTPWDEWIGRGAGFGAAAGALTKHKDLRKLLEIRTKGRAFTPGNKKMLSGILGNAFGGSVAGAGLGAYLRHRSQQRTGEKAVDEYNQLRLKQLYK